MEAAGAGAAMVSPTRTPSTMSLSPARVPDVDPIDAAAHLQLLGESLSLIGHRLQETEVSIGLRFFLGLFRERADVSLPAFRAWWRCRGVCLFCWTPSCVRWAR